LWDKHLLSVYEEVEDMAAIEEDILSTPDILRRTYERVAARKDTLGVPFGGPVALLGCGSSYCVALAAAAAYEREQAAPAQAIVASDYRPRPDWTHIAISRTGRTTELVRAMERARAAGAPVLLLGGEEDSPAARVADAVLPLEFAAEQGVIQTRFVSASIVALNTLLRAGKAEDRAWGLPDRVAQGLAALDPTPLLRFDHVVFLGRGSRSICRKRPCSSPRRTRRSITGMAPSPRPTRIPSSGASTRLATRRMRLCWTTCAAPGPRSTPRPTIRLSRWPKRNSWPYTRPVRVVWTLRRPVTSRAPSSSHADDVTLTDAHPKST